MWGGVTLLTSPTKPVTEVEMAAKDVEYALKKGDNEVVMKATERLRKLSP